jgi:radical SAM protein with 4Fe4S-binding SPASM domain
VWSFRQSLYDLYKRLQVADHQLLYLFLEITRTCNLRCLHCGSDCTSKDDTPTLTRESWLSLIDYVCSQFPKTLTFVITGGEPLTCPFLIDLGRRIMSKGMTWGIVTNGMLLDRKMMDSLKGAGVGSMTISLDGGRESHNWLRNSLHAYDRAIQAIEIAAASQTLYTDVVTCVYPKNLEELTFLAETLIDRGVRYWRLFRVFPRGRAAHNPHLLLDREKSTRLWEWIFENRPKYRNQGLEINYSCEGWFPFAMDRKLRREPFFCRAGVSIASILCDGTITGCPNNDPAFFEGNVARVDFAEKWRNGFEKFRHRAWMREGQCAHCENFAHCGGGSIQLWNGDGSSGALCLMKS